MDNAILIGLSRQVTLKRQMDVIANNLANVNTAGYKSDSLQFEEFLGPIARDEGMRGAMAQVSYVQDRGLVRDLSAGAFQQTGNDLDVAVSGDAWLVVQTPEGDRYTRNGQLKLSAAGQLVTGEGYPVMGGAGPIVFGPRESNIAIASDGSISTSEGDKDRLRLVRLPNPSAITKEDATLFASSVPAQPAPEARVAQGMIEGSNVEGVVEMTRMIETVRAYSSISQTIDRADQLRRDAISQLGRVDA